MGFPKEVAFGVDEFNNPKVLSSKDSLVQILYNIFVMEPNTMPTQPEKGIGIRRYLYRYKEDINILELKQKIFINCTDLLPFVEFDDIDVTVIDYKGNGLMLIVIPLKVTDESLLMAFSMDDKNNILFKFQVESLKITNQ